MFRVFTACRYAQLKPPTTFLRSLHSTTSLHSTPESPPKDSPNDSVPTEPQAPSTSLSYIDQALNEAIDDIVKTPKPKKGRARKSKAEATSQDGDVLQKKLTRTIKSKAEAISQDGDSLQKKPTRSRRKATSATVATSEPSPTTPKPKRQAATPKTRSRAGRPKIVAPENPRSDVKKYLQWGFGGNWEGGRAVGDRKRMNIVSEDACGT